MNKVHSTTDKPGGHRQRLEVRAHTFYTDNSVASGGEDSAPGAHDYFDASLAACKALTAIWFAKKNDFPLERVDVDVVRDESEERQGRYKLAVRLAFHGALSAQQRERLYAAVARCPVSKLMTTSEVIIETAPLDPV